MRGRHACDVLEFEANPPRRRRRARALHPFGAAILISGLSVLGGGASGAGTETGSGETVTYHVDPARSTVEFRLPATLHTVVGKSRAVSGQFTRPAAADGESFPVTGKIEIVARTLDTGNGSRDKKMRAESLAADRFPEIVFVPTRGVGKGITFAPGSTGSFRLEGQLTVRGVTKPLGIDTTARFSDGSITADGKTQLAFADFGVPDPSNLFLHVKPTVTVTFHLEARTHP